VREFEGKREEVRVMVAEAEAAISAGDVSGALARLKRVPQTSPHYARACVAMAEIHLKHRQDSAAYIKCYLHLVVSSTDLCGVCAAGRLQGAPASASDSAVRPRHGHWLPAAWCAATLQEKNGDCDAHCLLAEAYMAIQEPDKAAAAYEVRHHLARVHHAPWRVSLCAIATCLPRVLPA
jgi:hypothetical protein